MKRWILVANAAEAKILVTENARIDNLELVSEFVHPESRKKGVDLASDKPGCYKTDVGTHGAYETGDPKKVEGEHFAIQLAHALKNGWDQHQYASLVIIAPAHFYALINKHFHHHHSLEIVHLVKDYTKYSLIELHANLKKQLFG